MTDAYTVRERKTIFKTKLFSVFVDKLVDEVGLSCGRSDLVNMGSIAPDPGLLDAHIQCFTARCCTISGKDRENEFGHREFHLFIAPEVAQLIRSGDMRDSVSLAAYCLGKIERNGT